MTYVFYLFQFDLKNIYHQAQRDIIFELRRIAFDAELEPNNSGGNIEKRKSMYTRDYKKLGFIVSIHAYF